MADNRPIEERQRTLIGVEQDARLVGNEELHYYQECVVRMHRLKFLLEEVAKWLEDGRYPEFPLALEKRILTTMRGAASTDAPSAGSSSPEPERG